MVSQVLEAPTITDFVADETSVTLTWTRVDHIVSYTLQYKESSSNRWITISDLTKSSRTYTVNYLMPGTSYDFRVLANGNNTSYYGSDFSEIATYRTNALSNAILDDAFESLLLDDDELFM